MIPSKKITKGQLEIDGDFLLPSNNLSDLENVETARINLGLNIAGVETLSIADGGTGDLVLENNSSYLLHIVYETDKTKFITAIASNGQEGGTIQGNLVLQGDYSGIIFSLSISGNILTVTNDTLGAKTFKVSYNKTATI